MDHKPLFVVREEEGGPEWLSDRADYYPFSRPAAEHEITLDGLASLLDMDAEQANHHRFVGVHEALAAVLEQDVAHVTVKRVLRRLVDAGGLHNLRP